MHGIFVKEASPYQLYKIRKISLFHTLNNPVLLSTMKMCSFCSNTLPPSHLSFLNSIYLHVLFTSPLSYSSETISIWCFFFLCNLSTNFLTIFFPFLSPCTHCSLSAAFRRCPIIHWYCAAANGGRAISGLDTSTQLH